MVNSVRLDTLFHAVADTTRRDILLTLAKGERGVMELVERYDMSQPAVTKHLNVLEDAGLITREPRGRQRICRIVPKRLADGSAWIAKVRDYWNERLDALQQFLDESEPTPKGVRRK